MPAKKRKKPAKSPDIFSKSAVRKWWYFLILLLVIITVGFYVLFRAYPKPDEVEIAVGPNVDRIKKAGQIVIGTDATYPPMEFMDNDNDMLGYDIDFASRIAAELGVDEVIKNITWDDLFISLENGEVDIVISAVTIDDDRKEKYDFSDPYLNAGQVIITRKTEDNISSTEDLRDKKIAVQNGTTNEKEALKYTNEQLVLKYDDFIDATNALLNAEADAIFSDLPNAIDIVDTNPELKIASDPFTSDYYGILFRKGEEDLVQEVNQALNALRQRGVLVFLKQKWLE